MATPAFLRRPAPRWSPPALCIIVGLIACLTYLAAADLGVGPAATDRSFTLADPPWSQAMRPVLDVPIGGPWSASTVAARGSIAIAKGRRTAIRDLAAVASALAITLFGLALIETGVAAFPLLLTMIGVAMSPTFWLRGVVWTNDALAPALAMLAVWAGWRWLHTWRRAMLLTAIISGTLAILEDSAWVVLLPGAALLCRAHVPAQQRRRAGLVLIAMAACGAWPFVMRAIVAGQLDGPMLAADVPGPMTLWRQSMLGADPTALVPALRASLATEFTVIGAATAGVGVAAMAQTRPALYPVTATVAMLLTWFWIAPRPAGEWVSVPLAISGWAAVAVALTTLYHAAVRRLGTVVALVVAIVITAPSVVARAQAMASSAPDSESDTRNQLAYDAPILDLPDGTALVSETRRVDATLLLAARQARRTLVIVPHSIEHVAAALAAGRRVAALAGARTILERAGFVFERGWIGNMPLHQVGGRTHCVELRQGEPIDVGIQLAGATFSLHGAAAVAQAGTVTVRLTGLADIPVLRTEPRGLRYEITSPPDAAEVSLRIVRTSSPAPVVVNLPGAPTTAFATAESAATMTLCPGPLRGDPMLGGSDTARTRIDMMTVSPFGGGWHPPETDPDPFRWTATDRAAVAVTMAPPGPVRVTLTATPAARPQRKPTIALAVNGCALPSQAMPAGQGDYTWDVKAECWRTGVNQVWVMQGPLVSPSESGIADTRRMGARIGAIRLERLPRDQNAK